MDDTPKGAVTATEKRKDPDHPEDKDKTKL
jgi:hypothetical protein